MMEWIKVESHLPEDGQKILAIQRSEKEKIYNMRHDGYFRDTIYSCRFNVKEFIIESHGPVFYPSHWMPLPDLPEEQEN